MQLQCTPVLATLTVHPQMMKQGLLHDLLHRRKGYLIPTKLMQEQRLAQCQIDTDAKRVKDAG